LLFISLCSKKTKLLKNFVLTLSNADRLTKTILSKISFKLIKTLGMNCFDLNFIIAVCPLRGQIWVKQICQVLLKQKYRFSNLNFINALKELFVRTKNVITLIPVLEFLRHKTIVYILPKLISLDQIKAKMTVQQILKLRSKIIQSTELLLRIHNLSPVISSPLLVNVKILIEFCLQQSIFNDEKLALVLQRLSQKRPIPILFLRTLIQILLIYPTLNKFSLKILYRMIHANVWGSLSLWQGFIRCCKMCQPYSLKIICILPRTEFKRVLQNNTDLAEPLLRLIDDPTILKHVKKILMKKYRKNTVSQKILKYKTCLKKDIPYEHKKNKENEQLFNTREEIIYRIKIDNKKKVMLDMISGKIFF